MKDIAQLLREKETKLEQLAKEIKVLRAAAKILFGETGGVVTDFTFGTEEPAEPVIVPGKREKDLLP
jgi:hypothetical protein